VALFLLSRARGHPHAPPPLRCEIMIR
jgi:hypothetical protein